MIYDLNDVIVFDFY